MGSVVICILSSAAFSAASCVCGWLYEEKLTFIWAGAFLLLSCILAVTMQGWILETEEPQWNL